MEYTVFKNNVLEELEKMLLEAGEDGVVSKARECVAGAHDEDLRAAWGNGALPGICADFLFTKNFEENLEE